MLSSIIKFLFCISAILYVSMTIYGKLFVFRKKHPQFVSDYCATMAGFLVLYSLCALVLAWIMPTTIAKGLMLFFALSPFGIGLLANYHTEKYYTGLQVLLTICSIFYIL